MSVTRSRTRRLSAITVALISLFVAGPSGRENRAATKYTFEHFSVPGVLALPGGLAEDGTIVGTYDDAAFFRHGFVLRHGELVSVDFPAARGTGLFGINASGRFWGRASFPDTPQGARTVDFVSDPRGNLVPISFPLQSGQIAGVNDRGVIAATTFGVENNFTGIPVLIRDGTATEIDTPVGADGAWLTGINSRGAVIGYTNDDDFLFPQGFLVDGGRTTTLLFPGANDTVPTGINDRGQIVGYYSTDEVIGAFVYDRGVYSDFVYPIELPPGFEGCDYFVFGWPDLVSINNKGQILGRFSATFVAPPSCGVAPVTVNRLFIATPAN